MSGWAWRVVVPGAVAVAAVASCDDVSVHILSAQQYNVRYACLGPSAGVDVVQGAATGDNCDPTCLTATATDQNGTQLTFVYVTTTCPPYPGDYTAESSAQATDPSDPCTGAFAAYAAQTMCPAPCTDGGSDVCIPGDDGGGQTGEGGGQGSEAGGQGNDGGSADSSSE